MNRTPFAAGLALALAAAMLPTPSRAMSFHDSRFKSATEMRDFLVRQSTEAAARASAKRVVPGPVLDAWQGNGTPVTSDTYGQILPAITSDNSGGAYVAWLDFRTFTGDVYVNRLDANGNFPAGWSSAGTPVCVVDSFQAAVAIAPDGANGAFVACTEFLLSQSSQHDVILNHITPSGALAAGFPANGKRIALGNLTGYILESDGTGGVFIGFADAVDQARLIRLDSSGNLVSGWPAAGLPVGPAGTSDRAGASDGAGGFYYAWASNDSILALRIAANGTLASGWNAGGNVIAHGGFFASYVFLARLTSGDAMVTWSDFRNADIDVFCCRVAANGTFPTPWAVNGVAANTATGITYAGGVVGDNAGGAVSLWEDLSTGIAVGLGGQRITSTGGVASGWPVDGLALCPATQSKGGVTFVADGSGGAIAAWHDNLGSTGYDIYITRMPGNGARPAGFPAGGVQVTNVLRDEQYPVVTTDGSNGGILAWEDNRDSLTATRVYAARVLLDGTVGVEASLVEASAGDGSVRLHWYNPGGAFDATIERDAGRGFAAVASLRSDASGHLRYEDRDVVAGGEYRYRLLVDDGGAMRRLGEASLRVPNALALALAPSRPSPAVGAITVSLALPAAAPARLELVDVSGRRIETRDLTGLGAGQHLVRLGASPAPGVYVLRLTQGGKSVSERVVVAR